MRKLFLFLLVAGIMAAPAVTAEAAETTRNDVVVSENTRNRGTEDPEREEERLLREAKKVVREIFKAQREAKKTERAATSNEITKLREQMESADKDSKKELRAKISDLRENKKYDSVEEFLDNMILDYGDTTAKSEGYVVSVADTRKNLDAVITYEKATRTLIVANGDITIEITLDADGAYVNGEVLYAKGSHEEREEETE